MDCSFRSLKQNPCYTVTQSVFVFPVCVTFTPYQTDNLSVNPLHNPIYKGHTPADTCSRCCGEILEWWCHHNVQLSGVKALLKGSPLHLCWTFLPHNFSDRKQSEEPGGAWTLIVAGWDLDYTWTNSFLLQTELQQGVMGRGAAVLVKAT